MIQFYKEWKKFRENDDILSWACIGLIDAWRNSCNSFIEKPFTLDQLLKEIDRVIFFMLQNIDSRQLNSLIPKLVHQINNHLFCINGNVELCIYNLDDTEAIKKRFSNIIEATEKIQSITGKVLEAGRAVEDKIEIVRNKRTSA